MKIMTTYKTKIRDSHRALANTVGIYRQAVDFLIGVALEEWNSLKEIERSLEKQRAIECAIHHTKSNPCRRIVKLSATPLRNRPHMVFCSQGTFWGAGSTHGISVGCNPLVYP